MRRPFLFGVIFSLAFFGSFQASAQDSRWRGLSADERTMLDRMAADFYEAEMRLAQSRNIEAATAHIYVELSEQEKAAFREERRSEWRAMSEEQRRALRNVKFPAYANLAEEQKAPFRRVVLDRMAPAPLNAAEEDAAAATDGNDI